MLTTRAVIITRGDTSLNTARVACRHPGYRGHPSAGGAGPGVGGAVSGARAGAGTPRGEGPTTPGQARVSGSEAALTGGSNLVPWCG